MQKLFEAALGITSPWYVKKIDFDVVTKLPPTKVGGLAHSVLMTKVIKLAPS